MIYEQYQKLNENIIKIDSDTELIYSIFETQNALEYSIQNYEFAEGDLIDYYSYNIKANKSKLDYLVKKAKAQGILLDRLKQIELKSNIS